MRNICNDSEEICSKSGISYYDVTSDVAVTTDADYDVKAWCHHYPGYSWKTQNVTMKSIIIVIILSSDTFQTNITIQNLDV